MRGRGTAKSRQLLATERLTLAAIRTRLNALSAPELEAFAIRHAPPGKLADALGICSPAAAMSLPYPPLVGAQLVGAPLVGAQLVGDGDASALHVVRWERVELALGLELHRRDDASLNVQELARRVRAMCVGTLQGGARSS